VAEADSHPTAEQLADYRMVLRAAYGALGNASQAEDTAQDVFFKVFQNSRSYRFEQPFFHWLHRVT
jgi:DNA-directed RNA polymerase specialized sigma24 family protein